MFGIGRFFPPGAVVSWAVESWPLEIRIPEAACEYARVVVEHNTNVMCASEDLIAADPVPVESRWQAIDFLGKTILVVESGGTRSVLCRGGPGRVAAVARDLTPLRAWAQFAAPEGDCNGAVGATSMGRRPRFGCERAGQRFVAGGAGMK